MDINHCNINWSIVASEYIAAKTMADLFFLVASWRLISKLVSI